MDVIHSDVEFTEEQKQDMERKTQTRAMLVDAILSLEPEGAKNFCLCVFHDDGNLSTFLGNAPPSVTLQALEKTIEQLGKRAGALESKFTPGGTN